MTKTNSGIVCPACKMKNELDALICAYCYTPLNNNRQKTILLTKTLDSTGTLPTALDDTLDAHLKNRERFLDFEIPSKGIILIKLEDGKPIAAQQENAFILGRASAEITPPEYLVDLTPIGAFDYGISRLHALIRKIKDGYQIIDLESSNGTWLDGQRLVPKKPYPMDSGSRVRMGRLHVMVFYPRNSS